MSKLKDIKQIVVGIALIVIVFGLSFAVTQFKGCSDKITNPRELAPDEEVKITITPRSTIIKDKKEVREIPKNRKVQIIKKEDGTITIVEQPFYICFNPHFGLTMDTEGMLGIQVIRMYEWGLSGNFSKPGLALSLERDLTPYLNNSFIGVFVRSDEVWGVMMGVYL